MKKMLFCIIVLIASSAKSFSQQLQPSLPLTREDYLKKSKEQKTVLYAIAVPGSLLFIIGGLMYMSEFGDGLLPSGDSGYDEKKVKTGEAFMIAGGVLLIASVPFNLAFRKNKKKAMTMGLKNESAQQLQKNGFIVKSIPSLTLKISL